VQISLFKFLRYFQIFGGRLALPYRVKYLRQFIGSQTFNQSPPQRERFVFGTANAVSFSSVPFGKSKLGFDDEAYRAFLYGECGKNSSSGMTIRELEKTLKSMRSLGFNQYPSRVTPNEKGSATREQLEYIKGMWRKCARNKNDNALTAFFRK
jgi:hypothetical protein